MNSNLNRALAVALAAFAGVVPAIAQMDGDMYCVDPNNTKPYSDVFQNYLQRNELFGAAIGGEGTVSYNAMLGDYNGLLCGGGGPIRGRIGFSIGSRGSFQDDDPNQAGAFVDSSGRQVHDEFMKLTLGASFFDETGLQAGDKYSGFFASPSQGGNSFARLYMVRTPVGGTATATNYLYGNNSFNLSFLGAGGRYVYTKGSPVAGIAVRCVIEVIGDAARVNWQLTNSIVTTDAISLGLYFGQSVELLEENNGAEFSSFGPPDSFGARDAIVYTTVPGSKPFTVGQRFSGTAVPAYANFSVSPSAGFGLQVVNNASALTGFDPGSGVDQTPVDEFVIGEAPFLISGGFSTADPMFNDSLLSDGAFGANIDLDPAYIQKWLPTPVATGGVRDIVAYYRSTNGDSSYSPAAAGYSIVVDTPKAISTNAANINTSQPFSSPRYTIRVNVDNTGGFSNPNLEVDMQSVGVTLNLPAGITNPDTGARTITKTISQIPARTMSFIDFPITIDPELFGAQTYSVTVTPTPGVAKTVVGTINVAAVPRLLIRQFANLVSPPFQFSDNSWETILTGNSTTPLVLNQDFQAYTWDAVRQQYVTQPSAVRGQGTFIVSTTNLGSRVLGGSPQQPNDEFPSALDFTVPQNGGPGLIHLQTGWNLIGNPYNYAFPVNQIVGVPVDGTSSISFADLIAQGYTTGAFQYYDQDGKQYLTVASAGVPDARLQPNYGYWIYANQAFDLQFPALYDLFIRSAPHPDPAQRPSNWKLQLSAVGSSARDTDNYVGVVDGATSPATASVRKAPMAPTSPKSDTIYSFVTGDGGAAMTRSFRNTTGKQVFTYNVFSKNGGPITVSWPNIKQLPSSLKVSVSDPSSGKTIDARALAGYTFTAKSGGSKALTVTVTPVAPAPERIVSTTYSIVSSPSGKMAKLAYTTSVAGSATIHIMQGSKSFGDVVTNADAVEGTNTVLWPMTNGVGQSLPNGNYMLVFSVKGEGGDTATRTMPIVVRH